jgi:hypothetical protein
MAPGFNVSGRALLNPGLSAVHALVPLLGLLFLPAPALAVIYTAEAIEGWVVDAGTGRPLEGVIIVAHWQLMGGFEGGNPVGQLQIHEAVTDQAGRYYIPAWGPRFALRGRLRNASPNLLFFKPGYRHRVLDNRWYAGRDNSKSDWNGKTVTLERIEGSLLEYARHLQPLNDALWGVGHVWGEPCGWESFPRMLRAIDAQDARFRSAGINHASVVSNLRANQSLLAAANCRPVDEVLKQ